MQSTAEPLVAVIMGSKSDWETMRHAADILTRFGVSHECRVASAHRTPALVMEIVTTAERRGVEVLIAAAGGAAHLAGVTAAHTLLPVLGVPIESQSLKGLDSLLSTVQMPGGIPVGTLAIGKPARSTRRCWPWPFWRTIVRSCVSSCENIEPSKPRKSKPSAWTLDPQEQADSGMMALRDDRSAQEKAQGSAAAIPGLVACRERNCAATFMASYARKKFRTGSPGT